MQVTTDAAQGTESAVESIASEFGTNIEGGGVTGSKGAGSAASGAAAPKRKEDQKKCSGCGTPIDKNASFCKLCRKGALSGDSSGKKEKGGSASQPSDSSSSHKRRNERPSTPQDPTDSINK